MSITENEARQLGLGPPAKKRRKYGNVPTTVDGIKFHSKREAKRYGELVFLVSQRKISGLELQPYFQFVVNGVMIGSYRADFGYVENGKLVIEDVKGVKTQQYRLRKKLLLALHGIAVKEV